MEVWVLYETNDDLEQGPLINECYGVFINKEEALDKFEELEILYWETEEEYENNLERLYEEVSKGREELDRTGEYNDYKLTLTDFYG